MSHEFIIPSSIAFHFTETLRGSYTVVEPDGIKYAHPFADYSAYKSVNGKLVVPDAGVI